MGFFSRSRPLAETRVEPRLASTERRAITSLPGDGISWDMPGGFMSGPINGVESLAAVSGGVDLISNAIASLPVSIMQVQPDGSRTPAPGAAANSLIDRPSDHQSWPDLVCSLVSSLLLQGNAVAQVTSDGRGTTTGLTFIPWPWLTPMISDTTPARLLFDVTHTGPETRYMGLPRRLLGDQVMFVKLRGDAILGRSPFARSAGAVSAAVDIQEFASHAFRNQVTPTGVFSLDKTLDLDAKKRQVAHVMGRYSGTQKAGMPIFLDSTSTFTPISSTLIDAETLASRRYSVSDICRLLSIPEVLLQLGTTAPSTLTPYLSAFAQLCLTPLVVRLEHALRNVLPSGYEICFDLSGLARGDWTAIAAAQAVLVQSRIATPNDARQALGLPAHADGDQLAASPAPNFPADAKGMPALHSSPNGDGAHPGTHENGGSA